MKKGGSAAVSDFGMSRIKQGTEESNQTKSTVGPIKVR